MFTRGKGELYILQIAIASYHHTVARMADYRHCWRGQYIPQQCSWF